MIGVARSKFLAERVSLMPQWSSLKPATFRFPDFLVRFSFVFDVRIEEAYC